jgi:hypothetical protein
MTSMTYTAPEPPIHPAHLQPVVSDADADNRCAHGVRGRCPRCRANPQRFTENLARSVARRQDRR